MKKTITILIVLGLAVTQPAAPLLSWEVYDRVVAVVNNNPIVESEIQLRFEQLQKLKKITQTKFQYEKSRILDGFIEDALVRETAYDESIVISDTRVITYIENIMTQYFTSVSLKKSEIEKLVPKLSPRLANYIKDKENPKDEYLDKKLNEFIKFAEDGQKIPFKVYFEDLRKQMRKEQVMSIAIGITPPSQEEALNWYKKNIVQLGYEVLVKHILIRPEGTSLTDEKKTNDKLTQIRNSIISGASFEEMAKKYSQDPVSAVQGGDLGWVWLAELDPYFANFVFQMNQKGAISQVFKSGFGYHIVKYLGRRQVTFERVKKMIMFKLYNDSMLDQFGKWVVKKKKNSDIKIYMTDYVENREKS